MRNEVIASQNQPDINAGMEYLKEKFAEFYKSECVYRIFVYCGLIAEIYDDSQFARQICKSEQ